MLRKRNLLFGVLGLVAGALAGAKVLKALPTLPLSREHKMYRILGIKKPIIFGFLPYWLVDKSANDYSPQLTTLSYFGLIIGDNGHVVTKSKPQETEPGWNALQNDSLKAKLQTAQAKNLKISLVVYNQNEKSIQILLSDPETHAKNLIADITPIMKQYGFSDLNIDIESFAEVSPETKQQFTLFMHTVRQGVDQNQLGTLSVDVSPAAVIKPTYIYDIPVIGRLADTVILMAYDFNNRNSAISGPVAPIGGAGEVRDFDVQTAVNEMTKQVPPAKIILGVPLYGYQWETLANYPGTPVIPQTGSTATNSHADSILSTCVHCTKKLDEVSQQPYIIFPGTSDGIFEQIFYEDQESLLRKIALSRQNQMNGVALWALGYESGQMLKPLETYKNQDLD